MQLSLTLLLQGWGLPSQLYEGEPNFGPQTACDQVHTSFRAIQPPVSRQGWNAGVLVCVRRAAAHLLLVRPKATGLQDWGMGTQTGTPSWPLAMGICSFTFSLSSTQPYIWGFLLCASGASRPLPPRIQRDQKVQGGG